MRSSLLWQKDSNPKSANDARLLQIATSKNPHGLPWGVVSDALMNGGTLVMDEFDASIHPMALMNIINIFHNDEINTRNAQLVFNTHNPIFLDSSLFRRDEIKFVERDEKTGKSSHYSLADFRTSDGIRKGEDYMKNYFVNRYGAIRNVDFGPMIESLMRGSEVERDG